MSPDGFVDSRALDLTRLKDHIAIRKDHGLPPGLPPTPQPIQHVESTGIKPVAEGIIHQVGGHSQQTNVRRMLNPITLQSAEVIAIAQLFKEGLEDLPVTVPTSCAKLAFEMLSEVVLNAVVFKQCIVHIHEKDDRQPSAHAFLPPTLLTSCHYQPRTCWGRLEPE